MLSIAAENAAISAAFDPSYQYLPSGSGSSAVSACAPRTTIGAYAASALTLTTFNAAGTHLDKPSTVRVCLPRSATTGTACMI